MLLFVSIRSNSASSEAGFVPSFNINLSIPCLREKEEDEARLSPLQHEHINVLGHYSFTLSEVVMKGQLRPFNNFHENIEVP